MNGNIDTFTRLFSELEKRDSYWEEKAILDFTTGLRRLMERRGMSRKELAEKLGTSTAYVTRVLNGNARFTISSMMRLVKTLDGKLTLHVSSAEDNTATAN